MKTLAGHTALILGLGASGLSMARWCARLGARVVVTDTRENPPGLESMRRDVPDAEFVSGECSAGWLQAYNIRAVFKSPGLSPTEVAPVWLAAKAQALYTGGELSLFARALQDLSEERGYKPKVAAITGSNGKTTVTAMTGLLLERAGLNVAVAGNIGPPLLDTLTAHLQADTLPDAWVLELSSFQLDSLNLEDGFAPDAATVLNISEDHLDWHGSMQHYMAAKAQIWSSVKTVRIVNDDDAMSEVILGMAQDLTHQAKSEGANAQTKTRRKPATPRCIRFGLRSPSAPDQFGLESQAGVTWLACSSIAEPGGEAPVSVQRLMPAQALRIQGQHNALNALAALGLCTAMGQSLAPLLHGLREYRGEPHRVESLGVFDGVEYFDDSKGTNVGASVAALMGLGADRKIVLIAGGEGKGQDFAPLAQAAQEFARAVVLIGRDAPLIAAALQEENVKAAGVDVLDAADMNDAVQLASRAARPGDVVLLSPACASFDMFRDYVHRASTFVQAVHALYPEAGRT